jgi:hypothetical protein
MRRSRGGGRWWLNSPAAAPRLSPFAASVGSALAPPAPCRRRADRAIRMGSRGELSRLGAGNGEEAPRAPVGDFPLRQHQRRQWRQAHRLGAHSMQPDRASTSQAKVRAKRPLAQSGSSPRVTTGCTHDAREHPGTVPAPPLPGGSPPGTGSRAGLGNFQPALPGRFRPAATPSHRHRHRIRVRRVASSRSAHRSRKPAVVLLHGCSGVTPRFAAGRCG